MDQRVVRTKAVEAIYVAFGLMARAEERRKKAAEEVQNLARKIDPDNWQLILKELRRLYAENVPTDKAAEHIVGVGAAELKMAAFRKKLQDGARGDPDSLLSRVERAYPPIAPEPFARTRRAQEVTEAKEAPREPVGAGADPDYRPLDVSGDADRP